MSKILVFTEFQNNHLKRSSQELLQFAAKTGRPVVALALGTQAGAASTELGQYGAQEVYLSKDPAYDAYNPELFALALSEAIQKSSASLVLGSASSAGKDLFPRVAAKIQAGIVSDGVEITVNGDDVKVKKPLYAGKAIAIAEFKNSAVKMVLMRANQLPVTEADTSKTATI